MIEQIREGIVPVLGLTAMILFGAACLYAGFWFIEKIAYGLAWMFTNLPGGI
jgi:hypothetical protein